MFSNRIFTKKALSMCLLVFLFIFSGEELGAQNYAVPFLDPNSTGKAILAGVNYASGGGGIMNATGRIFVST